MSLPDNGKRESNERHVDTPVEFSESDTATPIAVQPNNEQNPELTPTVALKTTNEHFAKPVNYSNLSQQLRTMSVNRKQPKLVIYSSAHTQVQPHEFGVGGFLDMPIGGLIAGEHRVEKYLARGSFGTVWILRNMQTADYAAVKITRSNNFFQNAAQEEIKMLNKVQQHSRHPHIVDFLCHLEIASTEGQHVAILFEALGPNLEEIVHRSNQRIHLENVRIILKQVLYGLEHIHHLQIVHLDLKLANIMLAVSQIDIHNLVSYSNPHTTDYPIDLSTPNPTICVKIGDFGISHNMLEEGRPVKLSTCVIRSPEGFLTNTASTASDLWSFACVGYELVTGKDLFSCRTYPLDTDTSSHFRLMTAILGRIPRAPFESNLKPGFSHLFGADGFLIVTSNISNYSNIVETVMKRGFNATDANDFVEFLKSCLSYDPKQRMTVQQALTSSFLLSHGGRSDHQKEGSIVPEVCTSSPSVSTSSASLRTG